MLPNPPMTGYSTNWRPLEKKINRNGSSATAQCPAHEDRKPSLAVTRIEGSVLVYCHAGCDTTDVLHALDLTPSALFDDPRGIAYHYPAGRIVTRTPTKGFKQYGNTRGV